VRKSLRRSHCGGPALRGQIRGGRRKLRRHDTQPFEQLLLRRRGRLSPVRFQGAAAGKYGKLKDDQIKATGADYCIAACHNCHAQIHELSEHYGGNYPVVHLWTLLCLSLGVLGPNEREYLGMTSRRSMCSTRKRPCNARDPCSGGDRGRPSTCCRFIGLPPEPARLRAPGGGPLSGGPYHGHPINRRRTGIPLEKSVNVDPERRLRPSRCLSGTQGPGRRNPGNVHRHQ
jgi:hypothetical protein